MLIAVLLFSTGAAGESYPNYPSSPKGLKYLNDWVGEYQITNCVRCDDGSFPNQVKLKNFKSFWIAANQIPADRLPGCALTDMNVFIGFKFSSDDGSSHHYGETSLGLCDWKISGAWTKFLTIAPEIFHYQSTTGATDQITVQIEKVNANLFKIYRRVMNSNPTMGIPADYTEIAEAQKVP